MRLKELRKEAGLTQKMFAQQLGVAQNTISRWEAGTRSIDADTLANIAKYFDVTTDYLLGLSSHKKERPAVELSETKQAMLDLIDALSDEQVARLHEIATAALAM